MPLRSGYEDQACSVAASLEIVGERWTLLIIRDAFFGIRRFDDFQADLGLARNILQARLSRLVAAGIFSRERYHQHPERFEYRLTDMGIDLWPVIVSLLQWGDRYAERPGGPAVFLHHRDCGGTVSSHRRCERCGLELGPRDVVAELGPGASERHPLRRLSAD